MVHLSNNLNNKEWDDSIKIYWIVDLIGILSGDFSIRSQQ